ncbi:MAG TPA: HAD family phosphatase [Streptosporangiaceae bacterium]|nr:HAD family phosphatase [Streptosporangiaceae bacterium]
MRAILLDLDGVLVISEPLVRKGWNKLARERGILLREEDFRTRILGRRTVDVLEDVFGLDRHAARSLVAEGIDDKSAELRDGAELPPVPGAVEFVRKAASSGLKIAVVTSASAANAGLALRHIGLHELVGELVDASSPRRGKPYPDPYREGCRRLGVAPGDAVGFEDSLAGVAAVKAAGVRCVALATSQPRAALVQADLVIDDFRGHSPKSIAAALEWPPSPAQPVE